MVELRIVIRFFNSYCKFSSGIQTNCEFIGLDNNALDIAK